MNQAAEEIKGLYFPVLDHGFVSLVDYMGDDAAVAQAARCSYGAGTKQVSEDRGLIRRLRRDMHTSPFEMVEFKFHVRLPIFVARQLIRHRTANVNEYSLRYSFPSMQFYVPENEQMGTQSKKNKQGRAAPISSDAAELIKTRWRALQKESIELYELMVASDVDLARELARMHLPLSLYTEWYWKIDLHNLLHYLKLRVDKHAQWEIQQVSRVKAAIVKHVAPLSYEAWIDYNYQSRTFSRMEMQLLRSLIATNKEGLVCAKHPAYLTFGNAQTAGITEKEWEQFRDVFDSAASPDAYKPEQFELDFSSAESAEWYQEELKRYLPAVK